MSNTRRFGLVAIAVIAAAAAFVLVRPSGGPPAPGGGQRSARAAAPQYTTIKLGTSGGSPKQIQATKGQTLHLAFTADAPAEVHIHGYEREFAVKKGQTARVSFPANLDGVFDIENHSTDAVLAQLRVAP